MEYKKVTSLVQQVWPGWEIVRLIGRGSYGSVYEIHESKSGKLNMAAVKVISIPEEGSALPIGQDAASLNTYYSSIAETMEQEYITARELKNVGCSNIVGCDSYVKVPNPDGIGVILLIKMELLTDLNSVIQKQGFTHQDVIRLGMDICSALEVCRAKHVFHRDIKPANLFVAADGSYKLGDFGVAKRLEETGYAGSKQGTILYMAPEVYAGKDYDHRADLYSLGLVMYQLLNKGKLPFMTGTLNEQSQSEALRKRMRGDIMPMPAAESGELAEIVLRACNHDYQLRYSDPGQMRWELEKLLDPEDERVLIAPISTTPDVQIRFLGADGSVLQARSYRPGERVAVPAKPAEIEKDGAKYVFDRWLPDLSETATMTMDYRASYKKSMAAVAVKKEEKRKKKKKNRWVPILAACLMLIIGTVAAIWQPWKANTDKGSEVVVGSKQEETEKFSDSANWSKWKDDLPKEVSANRSDYEIEEKTLYRSSKKETTTSADSSMEGWTLYDTKQVDGGFGSWSEWSPTAVSSTSERNVETETRYRFREKETTTSTSSSMSGWELYDQETNMGDYGGWSGWSSDPVNSSNTRKVETKTQYQYRDITTSTGYTDWSGWSDWQDGYVSGDVLTKVETRTAYHYYYFICSNCGKQLPGQNVCYSWDGGCGRTYTGGQYTPIRSENPYSNTSDFGGVGMRYTIIGGDKVFAYTNSSSEYYVAPVTQYRYATRSTKEEKSYGSWSSWSDTAYSESSSREVQTRPMYRYCDRQEVTTYYFYRWGGWSDYSNTPVSSSDNRQVETQTYYRYQDKTYDTVYCYYRWSDWSDWADKEISKTEDLNVETKTVYRYKEK